jgi:ATP-dependent helicase/nuclease subunit A
MEKISRPRTGGNPMSEQKWTPEQEAAIVTRGCNLLVSAAAGSGKTAVLVERIIRQIMDPVTPVEVDRLLVVTFTNAAATEMRERVGIALVKELEKRPHSTYLQRQLTLLSSASIMTLHAFCLDVLRQYYYCIDLDPGFKMASNTETALLRTQTLEEVFEQRYAADDKDFLMLVEMYGGTRDDLKLGDMVLNLYDFSRSHPAPTKWLQQLIEPFEISDETIFDETTWVKEIRQFIRLQLIGCRERLVSALRLAEGLNGPSVYVATLQADIQCLDDMTDAFHKSWSDFSSALNEKLSGNLPRIKGDYEENIKEKIQLLRNGVKKQLGKIREEYFLRSLDEWLLDISSLQPVVKALVSLVSLFDQEYQRLKQTKCLLDFNDLEHKCLEILQGESTSLSSPAAADLQMRFAEILVDEYQDINEVQETILRLVAKDSDDSRNMFMVGDVKQSIYRFRLAEPGLFLHKYNNYHDEGSSLNRRINLACNFRSRRGVVEAVNYLFRQIMTPFIGEICYDERAELVLGAKYESECSVEPVEVHLIERYVPTVDDTHTDLEADNTDADELEGFALEANLIARRIKELMSGPEVVRIYDKESQSYRTLQYRDIVILIRAVKGKADVLLDVFRHYDIPAYGDLNTGYFEATEIQIMLSVLQIIDNPRQDISLASVLRSPIYGLQAADLATIRNCAPAEDYWDAVCLYAKQDDMLGEKLSRFLLQLESWRTLARHQPLSELIWQLYRDTGFYDYAGCMPGGLQRQANLRSLYDRARQYEQTNFRGLFRFLRFVERLRKSGSDLGTARSLNENEDVVRIMSIHKSKGLEFPVVFVANIGKQFNIMDLNQPALCHKELGFGPDVVDIERRIRYPSLAKRALQHRLRQETLSEEMRILYVALTRARERLILVGSVRRIDKQTSLWCDWIDYREPILPDWMLAHAKSWLDWLGPALVRHEHGAVLRSHGGNDASLQNLVRNGNSCWSVKVCNSVDVKTLEKKAETTAGTLWEKISEGERLPADLLTAQYPEIQRRLDWIYPFSASLGCPAKLSVSELKKTNFELPEDSEPLIQPVAFNRPRFLQVQTGLTSLERGSAVHLIFQHLDYQAGIDETGISKQIQELILRDLLTEEHARSINISEIAAFFQIPLGKRLAQAENVFREMKFSITLDAARIYPGVEHESIFMQGVVDCLFSEENGLILIDYKTDQAGHRIHRDLMSGYYKQLHLYAEAVEKLLHLPVLESYLYFVTTQEAILVCQNTKSI